MLQKEKKTSDEDHFEKNFHRRTVCAIGVANVVLGVAAVVAQVSFT